jgi:hypothetical protein
MSQKYRKEFTHNVKVGDVGQQVTNIFLVWGIFDVNKTVWGLQTIKLKFNLEISKKWLMKLKYNLCVA